MSTVRESLVRIAAALEQLVVIEARKAGGGKALEIAARQRSENEGRRSVELVKSDPEPA